MLSFLKRLPLLRDAEVRRRLKHIPIVLHSRHAGFRLRREFHRHFGGYWLQRRLAASSQAKIVIGAWGRYDAGWIPTEQESLDLCQPAHWQRYFQKNSVDAVLAEHVWEHLTWDEALAAARTCFAYLAPGGYFRLAVPDGLHPDPEYIALVKPDSREPNDHKILYTYKSIKTLFESVGFRVVLYEYFDESGTFHYHEWDRAGGTIWRSKRFDPRNATGKLASVYPCSVDNSLAYSSIILDAVKP